MATNPYTADAPGTLNTTGAPDGSGPTHSYAVRDPRNIDAPYADEQGWAPHLRTESNGVPDAERLGIAPIRQRQVFPGRPPNEWYDAYTDYDNARRHAVEAVDTDGFNARRSHELRRAPDPRWNPPMPSRVTAFLSPRSYAFWRPFARPPARNNGMHFSMADHRRTYDVLGMKPVTQKRNTFRVDPTPWDAQQYDVPPPVSPMVTGGMVQGLDVPTVRGSYRAGG